VNRVNIPTFKYHPDPVATGSIEPSDVVCIACGQVRGFIYKGPVYAEEELADVICPWCIANGRAHEKFNASFVDAAGVGGYGQWQTVLPEIVEEVAHRTPAFSGWQQERWFTHCDDAAEFLGPAGSKELEAFGAEAISAIQEEAGFRAENWDSYLQALDKESGPTAYVFRCRHCRALGGYSDCH
jgi:uncharacterized protein CbrC (UPF0167 family)